MSSDSVPKQIVDAIKGQHGDVIRSLLQAYPDEMVRHTPFGSQTWLGYAAQIGKVISAEALIDAGIDVNAGDKRDNRKPICSAAASGHYDMVSYLIRKGAELDTSLSVRNPLFAAIVGRSSQTVRMLLSAGIDSTVRYNSDTMKDMDAVAFAVMRGETECAQIIALWNAKGNDLLAKQALEDAHRITRMNTVGNGVA